MLDADPTSSLALSDPRSDSENRALRFRPRDERREDAEDAFQELCVLAGDGGGAIREQATLSWSHLSHLSKGLLRRHTRATGAKWVAHRRHPGAIWTGSINISMGGGQGEGTYHRRELAGPGVCVDRVLSIDVECFVRGGQRRVSDRHERDSRGRSGVPIDDSESATESGRRRESCDEVRVRDMIGEDGGRPLDGDELISVSSAVGQDARAIVAGRREVASRDVEGTRGGSEGAFDPFCGIERFDLRHWQAASSLDGSFGPDRVPPLKTGLTIDSAFRAMPQGRDENFEDNTKIRFYYSSSATETE